MKQHQTIPRGPPFEVLDGFRDAAGAVGGAVGASGSQGVPQRSPENLDWENEVKT